MLSLPALLLVSSWLREQWPVINGVNVRSCVKALFAYAINTHTAKLN